MGIMRIGNGFDVHVFSDERPLILGGVRIPYSRGLLGHSDADVLLHALTDAVLGALAWGDIGKWFPPTDELWKDADSRCLFAQVWNKAYEQGWMLVNCDSTVIAEKPRLAPFVDEIRQSVAGLFFAESDCVSIKASTTEKLGFVGREEGIAALSVVLLGRAKS